MSWLLLNHGPMAPPVNMAWDEALLESIQSIGQPVLRLYGWTTPAATFGYFQKYADVAGLTPLRPLIRRPTGGGLVPHDGDWTYSLTFPPQHRWYGLRAATSYQRVHEWVLAALNQMGCKAELAAESRRIAPGQCFVGAEKFDVVQGNRKLAGAAQRRTRDGLLIQGWIQPTAPIQRVALAAALAEAACLMLGQAGGGFDSGTSLDRRISELVETKYSRAEHNERR